MIRAKPQRNAAAELRQFDIAPCAERRDRDDERAQDSIQGADGLATCSTTAACFVPYRKVEKRLRDKGAEIDRSS
jgi:hypothetical protein